MTIHLNRRHLLLSGAGLALAGCAANRMTPAEAAQLLPGTKAVMDRHVAAGHVPGISVGVRMPDGQDVFLGAGTLDFDGAVPADEDSLWRIYSMTKPITGTAAALLIEDGVLTLDTPVAEFIPEFAAMTVVNDRASGLEARPATRTMTVRHLLTHTAGFTYHFFGDQPVANAYSRAGIFPVTGYNLSPRDIDGPKVRDLDEMARALADIPLMYEPGTEYLYSISLDVLGLVIQRASGMSFPDFVQRRLFHPIGMDDTVWRLRGADDRRRFAALYNYADGGREVVDPVAETAYAAPVTLFAGGAGLVSSARDYLAFLTTILDDGRAGRVRVMTPETARLIRSDILPEGVNPENGAFRYGFGGSVAHAAADNAGEFGWGGAAGTLGWLNTNTGMAGTIMLQQFGQSAPVAGDVKAAIAADLAAG